MKSVILAGGANKRFEGYDGNSIKPLMVIDQRPVLHDALYALSNMAFAASDMHVVVNEQNRASIENAVGDSAVHIVVQKELSGPATGIKAVYDEHAGLNELLVILADDAAFQRIDMMQDLARSHERRHAAASMALLVFGDPLLHHTIYDIDRDERLIGYRPSAPGETLRRCNASAFIVGREIFEKTYSALMPTDPDLRLARNLGHPAMFNHMVDSSGTDTFIAAPMYDIPYVSANTVEGLLAARHLVRQAS